MVSFVCGWIRGPSRGFVGSDNVVCGLVDGFSSKHQSLSASVLLVHVRTRHALAIVAPDFRAIARECWMRAFIAVCECTLQPCYRMEPSQEDKRAARHASSIIALVAIAPPLLRLFLDDAGCGSCFSASKPETMHGSASCWAWGRSLPAL